MSRLYRVPRVSPGVTAQSQIYVRICRTYWDYRKKKKQGRQHSKAGNKGSKMLQIYVVNNGREKRLPKPHGFAGNVAHDNKLTWIPTTKSRLVA